MLNRDGARHCFPTARKTGSLVRVVEREPAPDGRAVVFHAFLAAQFPIHFVSDPSEGGRSLYIEFACIKSRPLP